MIKFSIIMPAYNCENYIQKAIQSVLNQTYQTFELIIINDGSKDGTENVIKAIDDFRIRYILQENQGPGAARNMGILKSEGDYICFIDSDDEMEVNMLEEFNKVIERYDPEIVMSGYSEISAAGRQSLLADINEGFYERQSIIDNVIKTFVNCNNQGYYSLCNKAYKKEYLIEEKLLIEKNRNHGEDWWFNIQCFDKCKSFYYIKKTLYKYIHQNSNSLMSSFRVNQINYILLGQRQMQGIINKYGINNIEDLQDRFVYELYSYIVGLCKNNRREMKNMILKNSNVINSYLDINSFKKYPKNIQLVLGFLYKRKIFSLKGLCLLINGIKGR